MFSVSGFTGIDKYFQDVTFFVWNDNVSWRFHGIMEFLNSIHVRRAHLDQQKLLFRVISNFADTTSVEKRPHEFCHTSSERNQDTTYDFH